MYEATIHTFRYCKFEKYLVKYKFITENGISSVWPQLYKIQQVCFLYQMVYQQQEASLHSAVSLVC